VDEIEPAQGGGSEAARWDALARAARGRAVEDEAGLRREFVAFLLDGDAYALPIERVREIVRLRPITPMPRTPASVPGVISLRGEIVQVLNLRARLGLPVAEPTRSSRIVVVYGEDGAHSGLLVDAVREVLRLPEEAARPAAAGEREAVTSLLLRGQEFVSLLDVDRVLDVGCD